MSSAFVHFTKDPCWRPSDSFCPCEDFHSLLGDDWVPVIHPQQHSRGRRVDQDEGHDLFPAHAKFQPSNAATPVDVVQSASPGGVERQACSAGCCFGASATVLHAVEVARLQVQHFRQQYSECRKQAQVSIDKLYDATLRCCRDPLILETLQRQASEDQKALIGRTHAVQQAEQDMAALERLLIRHEKPAIKACVCPAPYRHAGNEMDDASSQMSDASSKAPTVLHGYYRLAREAFVYKERLEELDLDMAQLTTKHQQDLCMTSNLALCNSDHETPPQLRRQQLCEALAQSHCQMRAQREACLAQGIDPEIFRHRRVSQHGHRARKQSDPAQPGPSLCSLHLCGNGSDSKRLYDSVMGWLQQA